MRHWRSLSERENFIGKCKIFCPLMSSAGVKEHKTLMYAKTQQLFSSHDNYMLMSIKRVQSTQLKNVKASLDPNVKLLVAKNKIMKKALEDLDAEKYSGLIEQLHGDVVIAFYDGADPKSILNVSQDNMRKANAVAGDIAPTDVIIPAGPTGLGPEKINIFQAAKMSTKINKGKIDLATDHKLLSEGSVVSISDASLLKMLNIRPFEFGLDIVNIYEGSESFAKDVLLIEEDDIANAMSESISLVAALSLGTGIPTPASVPYEIMNAFADVTMVSLGLGINIKESSS